MKYVGEKHKGPIKRDSDEANNESTRSFYLCMCFLLKGETERGRVHIFPAGNKHETVYMLGVLKTLARFIKLEQMTKLVTIKAFFLNFSTILK